MIVWMLVVIILVAFFVFNWAELGQRMQGRNLWIVLAWSAAAMVAWQVSLEILKFGQIISFVILLLVLVLGYYQLQKINPKLKRAAKRMKSKSKKHRPKKHH